MLKFHSAGALRKEAFVREVMKHFHWPNGIANVLAFLAGIVIVLMMVHVTADVVGRLLFNRPLDGTLEIVAGYYMVAVIFFPLAYVVQNDGHIEVDLFTRRLPHAYRRALNVFASLFGLVFIAFFIWRTLDGALHAYRISEVRETADGVIAIWPSRFYLPVGLAAMWLCILYQFVVSLRNWSEDRGPEEPHASGPGTHE